MQPDVQLPQSHLYNIQACAQTICGPNRSENQDAVLVDGIITQHSSKLLSINCAIENPLSIAVVDGMGGYEGGKAAAFLAAMGLSEFVPTYYNADELNALCNRLSRMILQAGHAWGTPDMGAAFAMLIINDERYTVLNIGDCRVYRYEEGILGLLSEDDRSKIGASSLTQSLGGFTSNLDSHTLTEPLKEEDFFLLCSDGVWETLGDDWLQSLCNPSDPSKTVQSVIDSCLKQNARDNCSAIAVSVCRLEGRPNGR